MKKRKRFSAAFGISLLLTVLWGCSKGMDYPMEDSEIEKEGEGTTIARWEEQLQATSQNSFNTYQINIDADVVMPQVNSMSVIEVSEPEFDAAYKKQIIDTIFGNSKIYYNDDEHAPIAELDERIEMYRNRIVDNPHKDKADSNYTGHHRKQDEYWEDKIAICEEAKNSAPSDYLLAENFEADSYLGEREGIAYTISFTECWNQYNAREKIILLEAKSLWDVCPEELRTENQIWYDIESAWHVYDGPHEDISENNQCSLSVDEARNMASHFLEQLNLPELIEINCIELRWYGELLPIPGEKNHYQVNNVKDGYIFAYGQGMDGVVFSDFLTDSAAVNEAWYDEEEEAYALKSGVVVAVTDEGIVRMELKNLLSIETMVDHVECLETGSIRNIIKNELKEDIDQFGEYPDTLSFDLLELGYMRIKDGTSEHRYSFIPAWRLVNKEIMWQSGIYINAIDGSVIQVKEVL